MRQFPAVVISSTLMSEPEFIRRPSPKPSTFPGPITFMFFLPSILIPAVVVPLQLEPITKVPEIVWPFNPSVILFVPTTKPSPEQPFKSLSKVVSCIIVLPQVTECDMLALIKKRTIKTVGINTFFIFFNLQ